MLITLILLNNNAENYLRIENETIPVNDIFLICIKWIRKIDWLYLNVLEFLKISKLLLKIVKKIKKLIKLFETKKKHRLFDCLFNHYCFYEFVNFIWHYYYAN